MPKAALAALGTGAVVVLAVGAVFAYRTWDYIEHDNDFCLSCHLMVDPYERFSQSAHRGLGCKACHMPTFAGRSRMALTQIVENPEELEEHAVVPNEKCVSCHVDGDPEKWTLISASAGHRVHFESQDTALAGLQCVQCHSSGVHEFAATSETCGQSGCHEDTRIRLGEMGRLTIHCVACHEFSRPLPDSVVLAGETDALRPQASECLSCHAMRERVGLFPPGDPHGGACGACHDPHEQTTPADAVQTCAGAGCHASADTLTPMHRGLDEGVLERCTECHAPHDARLEQPDCITCHRGIMDDDPGTARAVAHADARGARPPSPSPTSSPWVHTVALTTAPAAQPMASRSAAEADATPQATARSDTVAFRHSQHRGVQCTSCHTSQDRHGAVTVTTIRDCRSCHHVPARAGVQCVECHEAGELTGARAVTRTLELSVGSRTGRLAFAHPVHRGVSCTECHRQGLELSAAAVSCASCHEQHHRANSDCASCHVAAEAAHPPRVVHVTCAGSGCHSELPFRSRPESREFCLVCHTGMEDHEPGRRCAECHALPPWRAEAGGGA